MSQAAPRPEFLKKIAGVEPSSRSESAGTIARPSSLAGQRHRIDYGVEISLTTAPPVADEPQTSESQTSAELLTGGDTLERFVAKYGQCFDSYLATEPGRLSFWSRQGLGLISYFRRGRYILVGGGLIAPDEHKETLLKEFVEQTKRDNLRAAFLNISEEDVPLFRQYGFRVTKWGEEPLLDLRTLSWSGKSYEWVRRQSNYCLRNGVVASEVRQRDLDPAEWERTMAEVREIGVQSLSKKAQPKGMRFLEGCIDEHELGLRRLFIARSDQGRGRIEGFVICNPLRNGTAWSTELYRHRVDSVRGTVAFLFHHLIEQMRVEGVERVQLCVDPARNCSTPLPGDGPLVRLSLSWSQKYFGFVFDFAGVHHFRSRFRPYYANRYVCAQPGAPFALLRTFFKATGCFQLHYTNLLRICLDRIRKRVSRKTLAASD